ncbi:MAG: RHS repeat-associated core domain-containing protein, partial [Bryobacterales bacterium]|nr:RHS repeat-associated core domain-containing protein [Bryobacterales bacterium]
PQTAPDSLISDPGGTPQVGADSPPAVASIYPNNRWNGGGVHYDAAGNQDQLPGSRTRSYDAENRITAAVTPGAGITYTASYAYDGEGRRVKKVVNGATTIYVYDAFGQLAAEYSTLAPSELGVRYYTLDAVLGSTRLITDASGNVRRRIDYAPFGEELPVGIRQLSCGSGCDVNAQYGGTLYPGPADFVNAKFTGKERDAETGLDYFGARYFAGAQGRWASPDVINLTNARLLNPSNTLNKYVYAANNPLKYVDPDGLDITLYYRAPSGAAMDFGHVFVGALNQQTGEVSFLDYYPKNGTDSFGFGAGEFNRGNFQDRAGQNYASLTIQTTPEQAQKVIDFIKPLVSRQAPDYSALSRNCTTVCQDALADLGLNLGDLTPTGLWNDLFGRFSAKALGRNRLGVVGAVQNLFQPIRPEYRPGTEFGVPRNFGPGNFDLFRLYLNQLSGPQPKACVEVVDSATGARSKQCE